MENIASKAVQNVLQSNPKGDSQGQMIEKQTKLIHELRLKETDTLS